MTEQTTTEQTESNRKGLPLEIARKADGIVKRLNKGEVVKSLLFRAKKDFAMEFLMTGNLNADGPSTHQIVSALYNGHTYQYGPADARQTMELPANPSMIEDIAEQVPESEANIPTVKVAPKVQIKNAMLESAKKMLASGLSIEQITTFLGLKPEDVEALTTAE